MMTRSQTRIAQLEARISELEKENEKLDKEKSVLMAVAAGNYKRGEEFKAICREYFTAEYIDACARGMDSALVSEYFRDTEEEDNLLVQSMLEHNDEDLEDRLWEHYQDTKGHRNSIDGDLNYLREHCKDANQIKRLFDEDNRQEGYAYDIDKDEYYKFDEDSDEDTDEDYYNRDQIPDTEESEECARCKKTFRYYLHDCTCDDCFDFTYFVCKDCEYKMKGCGICGKK
eukprot:scaffold20548_cov105-Phaeocystis_antarctica.AAC.1